MNNVITKLKKYYKIILLLLSVVLLITVYICWPKKEHPSNHSDQTPVETIIEEKKPEIKKEIYYGFLFLGSDKGAQNTNGGNHTDSITYVAYSPEKNKAYIMPIYRDVLIPLTCGGEKNINHVYRDNGPDCLIKSVEKMIMLPVDYYLYTTADAFVSIGDSLGGIEITPSETFCSPYSNDGKTYCVESGKKVTMDGNMLLAYARDRNHSNGVPRANRHQAILSALVKGCMKQFGTCTKAVGLEMVKGNIAHNIPLLSLDDLKDSIITPKETLVAETLNTIKGENFSDNLGEWHMRIDQNDIKVKKGIIEKEFGERKAENI